MLTVEQLARENPGAQLYLAIGSDMLLSFDGWHRWQDILRLAHLVVTDVYKRQILTKLDGTAKGGCVVAVKQRLGLPVRFIGVGEGIDDLLPFTPEGFVEELLPREWKH